jgi:hypothetical protein
MVFETRPTWDVRVMKFLSSGYFRGKAFENQAIQEGSDLRSQYMTCPGTRDGVGLVETVVAFFFFFISASYLSVIAFDLMHAVSYCVASAV